MYISGESMPNMNSLASAMWPGMLNKDTSNTDANTNNNDDNWATLHYLYLPLAK